MEDPSSSEWCRCPYDSSHTVPTPRLGVHLVKCRNSIRDNDPKRYKEITRTMEACRFSSLHVVRKDELVQHEANCPYRESQQQEEEGAAAAQFSRLSVASHRESPSAYLAAGEEDWEEEARRDGYADRTFAYDGKRTDSSTGVASLALFQNMSRSHREHLRSEHRVRMGGLDVEAKSSIPGMDAEEANKGGKKKKKRKKKKPTTDNGVE